MKPGRIFFALVGVMALGSLIVQPAGAGVFADPGLEPFQRTWERTDAPVDDGVTARTWMWGPESYTPQGIMERYDDSPGGERLVAYFDKSRMEITNPSGDPNSIWYVTNGLLATEMITGQGQVGDNAFVSSQPAVVNVAGDANDPNGPTYASFNGLLDVSSRPEGTVVIESVSRSGQLSSDVTLDIYGVVVGFVDPVTNHGIAQPFWEFMNSSGTVYENGNYVTAPLFENAFFATGRPITEAYWAIVQVAGTPRDVLMQCFERRCLTYTPGNPEGFVVEAGNVGLHYYDWRYEDVTSDPYPPSGELLYSSGLTEWGTEVVDDGEYFVEDGTYHLYAEPGGILFPYFDSGDPYTDVRVDLDVRLVTEQSLFVDACLATRLDPNSFAYVYSFCLTGDGAVYATYENFDTETYEELLSFEATPDGLNPSEWTTLSIIMRGDELWYLVNYELVGTTTYAGPPGGFVGFYVFNFDDFPVEFEFTNLAIWAIE